MVLNKIVNKISMHWLQQKSNKALKLFGLIDFMATDNIPHPTTLKRLQQNVKLELPKLLHHIINLLSTKYGLV